MLTAAQFGELYLTTFPYVVRTLGKRGVPEDLAEECAQAAFFKAWRRRDSLREPNYFRTWVTRIAINEHLDTLRRRRGEQLTDVAIDPQLSVSLERLRKMERIDNAARMILSHRDQRVLKLYLAGYIDSEIGPKVNLSRDRVRVRMHRIRNRLRQRLA